MLQLEGLNIGDMALTERDVFRISRNTTINSITNFIRKRAGRIPEFQILDLIIPTERRIRSVVGGMETSLGTTLWEPLAKNLAIHNGFEVVRGGLLAPRLMPGNLQNTVQMLVEGRNNRMPMYDAQHCHDRIREVCQNFVVNPITDFTIPPRGFGVDIWLRKDGINYLFDTKTVQSNVGGYSKYVNQIFNWYAYFYSRFPQENAFARIVFPYNPYIGSNFWDKTKGKGWPLEPNNEGWVENQFWNFCSGIDNTYEIILEAFRDIAEIGDLQNITQQLFYGRTTL